MPSAGKSRRNKAWFRIASTFGERRGALPEKHPDVAKAMEKMHNEDPKKWGKEMRPKWEAAPEA
jgi:hypothetical protein